MCPDLWCGSGERLQRSSRPGRRDAKGNADAADVDGVEAKMKEFLAGFSDLHHEVLLILAEDDLVAATSAGTARRTGRSPGFRPPAAR